MTTKQHLEHLLENGSPFYFTERALNPPSIAVGYNTNLDMIVDSAALFGKLGADSLEAKCEDHEEISSVQDLYECFLAHFKRGAAAERFVNNRSVFDKIIEATKACENVKVHIGGNAALMANQMAKDGAKILLGGPVGPELSQLLNKNITLSGMKGEVQDEVHLIMEYKKGVKIGGFESPLANRFIISADVANGIVSGVDEFHAAIPEFKPKAVVISGLHILQSQPPALREQRLEAVVKAMNSVEESLPVQVELGSMSSNVYIHELTHSVLLHCDAFGCNEQELNSLMESNDLSGRVNLNNPLTVIECMRELFAYIQKTKQVKGIQSRVLSRIHFHSLTFHCICQRADKEWKNPVVCVAAGALACSRNASDVATVSDIDPEGCDILRPLDFFDKLPATLDAKDKGLLFRNWKEDLETGVQVHFAVAPVCVCKKPVRTVGLGDSISATGILASF
eukprot:GCRY01001010.1.p1 GENE.GCRY01001010.1~~GCRY01001010.1.p1  ORF type:complete len:453 (-),score=108.97 GCRY01001010.1:489-1847(-)